MIDNNLEKYNGNEKCPVRDVLDRFGDKWSTLVILMLGDTEVLRFNELHRHIQTISEKMLTVTLKKLEADGLIDRKIYPQIPPRVEYRLTDMGKSLVPLIQNLVHWANEHMPAIDKARVHYQAH